MIDAKNLFESLSLQDEISERKFINFLNNTLNEVSCAIPSKDKSKLSKVFTIADSIDLDSRYESCIVDNIMFLNTAKTDYKSEFVRKLANANNSVFKENCKGRKLKG